MATSAPIVVRLPPFVRSAAVGVVATGADLLSLTLLVEVLHLTPTVANVPALLVGAAVQFLGCRFFVFDARGGSLARHLAGFAIAELGAFALNAVLFHILVSASPLPYPVARIAGQALVYVFFSFPVWTRVFRGDVRDPRPDVVDP